MIKFNLQVGLPDELVVEFFRTLGDFDAKHDPQQNKVFIEIEGQSDWSTQQLKELANSLSPQFGNFVITEAAMDEP